MARNLDAKCRKCRRAGEKLFLKGDRCVTPKCAIIRKPYAPGVHGKKFSRGQSEFGKQLAMKQKIKRIYGVLERQFRKHFDEVKNKKGVIGELFLARLEMRLDNAVYRMGIGNSRTQARQLVNHGLVKVNGKKVTVPSYEIKVGDTVNIPENKAVNKYFKNQVQILKNMKNFPSWIDFDGVKLEGKIKSTPGRDGMETSIDPQMVVEFYSR